MRSWVAAGLTALQLLCTWPVLAAERDWIGVVKTMDGSAVVVRGGQTLDIREGMEIFEADVLQTGTAGSLGLVFSDDTRLALGPGSEVSIDAYLFQPLEGRFAFIIRILTGTISFLSGKITKLAPDAVRLETPEATIGVRGTHALIRVVG